MENEEREILKRFKAEVKNVLGDRLDRVVLFGSRSRGDANPESDFEPIGNRSELTGNGSKESF